MIDKYDSLLNKKDYEKEQDELLTFLLESRFFNNWKNQELPSDVNPLSNATQIEFFITPTCNQKCEYCYLVKYDELYPHSINTKDNIFKNLNSVLNWIKENDFYISNIDLFSGEIWHLKLGQDFLTCLYDFCKKNPGYIGAFSIPSNGSFLLKDENFFIIQNFIDKFKKIGVDLCFSLSIDGKIIENKMRPLNSGENKEDDFYERAFLFARHNDFGFHPMVSAQSVKYWIENYQWWEEKFKEYDMNIYSLMMLEVRNADWTDESINDYNIFMNYLIEDLAKKCNYNSELMAKALFNFPKRQNEIIPNLTVSNYTPYGLNLSSSYPGCTIPSHLCIRLGDLAICPCHRTSYEKNIYGYFKTDDSNKIIGIKANNPYLATRILFGDNTICNPKCDVCKFNAFCLKGCFGAQMEYNNDPFMPIPVVCKFFEFKLNNLIRLYEKYGIIDYLKQLAREENSQSDVTKKLLKECERIKNGLG